jgi:chromosome partitioning protein
MDANKNIKPLPPTVDFRAMEEISISASSMVQMVRDHVLAPEKTKKEPIFSASDFLEIAEITRGRFNYLFDKHPELPRGKIVGGRREFTLTEFRVWMRFVRAPKLRDPEKSTACCVAVTNFKGGSTKTTTAATLAQGLSLRGLNCLVLDLDPQGSCSSLFGYLPDIDVELDMTAAPLFAGHASSIDSAIRSTYWDGVDIVTANPNLFNAEFYLPARQRTEHGFEFWTCLDSGLDEARAKYDVIIIDTPPTLSYITINALIAADGILMPLVPSSLDFASSAQFWSLSVDLLRSLHKNGNVNPKKFCFIDVLLAKVDSSVGVSSTVRDWIISAYGSKVLPVEIPKTSIADTASATFGTVYDMTPSSVSPKTLRRAKLAYESMTNHLEQQIRGVWIAQSNEISNGDANG